MSGQGPSGFSWTQKLTKKLFSRQAQPLPVREQARPSRTLQRTVNGPSTIHSSDIWGLFSSTQDDQNTSIFGLQYSTFYLYSTFWSEIDFSDYWTYSSRKLGPINSCSKCVTKQEQQGPQATKKKIWTLVCSIFLVTLKQCYLWKQF